LRLEVLETARTKAKEIIETGTKGFEPELEKARQTFKEDIAKDSKEAEQKIEAVVDFVVTKFEERLK
jgi:F0F1-type ATP synthase membrane subunit b/b'